MSENVVTLLRCGNRIVVDPTTEPIRDLLIPKLSFSTKQLLCGLAAVLAGTKIKLTDFVAYMLDHRSRIGTSLGFYHKITQALTSAGYTVNMRNLRPHARPEVFEPMWERLVEPGSGIELRALQEECLLKIFSTLAAQLPGRIDCPPGFGKTFIIGVVALLLPLARIHIVSRRVAVLKGRILPELRQMLPDVGMCGGGEKTTGNRVQLFTFKSLPNSDGAADILFVDEVHEAAADQAAGYLARYNKSINIGFSATHDMRIDDKDFRCEAMCGPVIHRVQYQDAVASQLVVPMEVRWSDVKLETNPCEGVSNDITRKKWGLWRNEARNLIIANDARRYPDKQVLVTCDTIEHVLALKKHLPEFAVVYAENGILPSDERYFRSQGLWPPEGLSLMTTERRDKLTRMFSHNKLKKAIVNTVWSVGVSFNYLEVLCRADGGSSPINDTQIPGRNSRINPGIGKTLGIIHDYLDQFDAGFKQRAGSRRRSYASHGWRQVMPVKPDDGEQGGLFTV